MKFLYLAVFPILFAHCSGQQTTKDSLYSSDFKWRLKIPAFLVSENKEEWKRVQDAGKNAISETYNAQLRNKVKTIFIFKSADNSFFEAVGEPINKEQAANYSQTCERMNDIFYNTVKTQIPTAQVDTTKGVELVDNIPFQFLRARITFPNGTSKTTVSYRSVFDNIELTVSAMYSNQASGDEITRAFKSSTFGKPE